MGNHVLWHMSHALKQLKIEHITHWHSKNGLSHPCQLEVLTLGMAFGSVLLRGTLLQIMKIIIL